MSDGESREPTREEVAAWRGGTLLEFGTPWCGYCRAAAPHVSQALSHHADVRHVKVHDGPGRPLGRAFRVTLWPTLVFLRDGVEVARLVRPRDAGPIDDALVDAAGQ